MQRNETFTKTSSPKHPIPTHPSLWPKNHGEQWTHTIYIIYVRSVNKQPKVIIKFTCCANENDLGRYTMHEHNEMWRWPQWWYIPSSNVYACVWLCFYVHRLFSQRGILAQLQEFSEDTRHPHTQTQAHTHWLTQNNDNNSCRRCVGTIATSKQLW